MAIVLRSDNVMQHFKKHFFFGISHKTELQMRAFIFSFILDPVKNVSIKIEQQTSRENWKVKLPKYFYQQQRKKLVNHE